MSFSLRSCFLHGCFCVMALSYVEEVNAETQGSLVVFEASRDCGPLAFGYHDNCRNIDYSMDLQRPTSSRTEDSALKSLLEALPYKNTVSYTYQCTSRLMSPAFFIWNSDESTKTSISSDQQGLVRTVSSQISGSKMTLNVKISFRSSQPVHPGCSLVILGSQILPSLPLLRAIGDNILGDLNSLKGLPSGLRNAATLPEKWRVVQGMPSRLDSIIFDLDADFSALELERDELLEVSEEERSSVQRERLSLIEASGGLIDQLRARKEEVVLLRKSVVDALPLTETCSDSNTSSGAICLKSVQEIEAESNLLFENARIKAQGFVDFLSGEVSRINDDLSLQTKQINEIIKKLKLEISSEGDNQ